MFFKLVLKGFKLKKLVVEPKKRLNISVESDEEPVDRKLNQSRSGSTPNNRSRSE